MDDHTTNYNWEMPDVAADDGTWGDILRAFIVALDANLKSVSDTANSSGFVVVASGAVSAASYLDIALPNTYGFYKLILNGVTPGIGNDGAQVLMRINVGAGLYTTQYETNITYVQAGSTFTSATAITSAFVLSLGLQAEHKSGHIEVNIPTADPDSFPAIFGSGNNRLAAGGGAWANMTFGGLRPNNGLVQAVRVLMTTGTFSGKFVLLGVRNS